MPAPLIILPDSGADLLRRELALAFTELGFAVLRPRPGELTDTGSPQYLPRLLQLRPRLFFSVNLQGLLPGGFAPRLLHSAGVPVLAWFVDNPWHVLAGMRDPSWKNFCLAVTDAGFVRPLALAQARLLTDLPPQDAATDVRKCAGRAAEASPDRASCEAPANVAQDAAAGASCSAPRTMAAGVFHLPLAACPRCLAESRLYAASPYPLLERQCASAAEPPWTLPATPEAVRPIGETVFVVRSAFPGKDVFFAGQALPAGVLAEAKAFAMDGGRPDFAWWTARLGLSPDGFWPGKKARASGLGAAEANRFWRAACLAALLTQNIPDNLTIFGDAGWRGELREFFADQTPGLLAARDGGGRAAGASQDRSW